jgi:hypothetical protein
VFDATNSEAKIYIISSQLQKVLKSMNIKMKQTLAYMLRKGACLGGDFGNWKMIQQ